MLNLNISGMKELTAKLNKTREEVKKKIAREATGKMAAIVRDEAKRIVYVAPAPYRIYNKIGGRVVSATVQPGHVGRNILMKYIPENERKGLTSEHIVTVGMTLNGPYGARNIAVFLEYGINMSKPHPFIRPAFESKKTDALSEAKKVLAAELGKIWT